MRAAGRVVICWNKSAHDAKPAGDLPPLLGRCGHSTPGVPEGSPKVDSMAAAEHLARPPDLHPEKGGVPAVWIRGLFREEQSRNVAGRRVGTRAS